MHGSEHEAIHCQNNVDEWLLKLAPPPRYAFAHLDLERLIVVLAFVAVAMAVWRGAGEGTQRRRWERPQKGTGEDGMEHAAHCPPTCAHDHSEPARGARDFGLARQRKVPNGPK